MASNEIVSININEKKLKVMVIGTSAIIGHGR